MKYAANIQIKFETSKSGNLKSAAKVQQNGLSKS